MTIQRYKEFRDHLSDCCCEMEEDASGDYVLYEEHHAQAETLAEALREVILDHEGSTEDTDSASIRAARKALTEWESSHDR